MSSLKGTPPVHPFTRSSLARATAWLRSTAVVATAAVAVVSGCATSAVDPVATTRAVPGSAPIDAVTVPVERAVDGDTIVVTHPDHGQLTVRLIGIDTPETKDPDAPVGCFGPQAAARTAELTAGQHVRLELDPRQADTDRYGRTLAYVWLVSGQLLNEQLLAGGYGREYTYHHNPYVYRDRFLAAEETARTSMKGLWSECSES